MADPHAVTLPVLSLPTCPTPADDLGPDAPGTDAPHTGTGAPVDDAADTDAGAAGTAGAAETAGAAGAVVRPPGLTDQHRMRLHTELIRAGVPPHPGDLRAIGQLAELDEGAVTCVARWIQLAARLPAYTDPHIDGPLPAPEAPAAPVPKACVPPAPVPAASVPVPAQSGQREDRPDPRQDPRLVAW